MLKEFGQLVGLIFIIISVLPLFKKHSPFYILLAIGAYLVLFAFIKPQFLKYPYKIWMKIALILGFINQRIILGIAYYVVLTPIALTRKILKLDSLYLKWDKDIDSYKVKKNNRKSDHLKHQF